MEATKRTARIGARTPITPMSVRAQPERRDHLLLGDSPHVEWCEISYHQTNDRVGDPAAKATEGCPTIRISDEVWAVSRLLVPHAHAAPSILDKAQIRIVYSRRLGRWSDQFHSVFGSARRDRSGSAVSGIRVSRRLGRAPISWFRIEE